MATSTKEQEYIAQIKAQEQLIQQLTQQLELHSKQNELLQQQINALTEILIQMRKDKFGSKSEKTKILSQQLNLFNEPEAYADPSEKEPVEKITNKGVSVRARKVREDALKDLPVVVHEFDLNDEDKTCPQCNCSLKKIGSSLLEISLTISPLRSRSED